jgi:hypothetical protein
MMALHPSPCCRQEAARLRVEAEHFRLGGLLGQLGEAGGRLGADGRGRILDNNPCSRLELALPRR